MSVVPVTEWREGHHRSLPPWGHVWKPDMVPRTLNATTRARPRGAVF